MTAVVAMLALGASSWLLRVLFVALVPPERLPTSFSAALQHLPPAVMAALVAVSVIHLTRGDSAAAAASVVLAVVLVGVVVKRTGSMPLGIAVGLGAAVLLDVVLV